MNESPRTGEARKYRWPWFVLAFFLLGVVLAVLWVRHEVRRIQRWKAESTQTLGTAPPTR